MSDICEVPTKCVRSMETFDVFAKILFIDFEGRSDGESIRKIISQIRPRQLVSVSLLTFIILFSGSKRGLLNNKCQHRCVLFWKV